MKYTIVDDDRYDDVVRIRTKGWDGHNRLLWVYRKELDEFLSHPERFRETTGLFETDDTWDKPGRKKFGGTNWEICKWQRLIIKKSFMRRYKWAWGIPLIIVLFASNVTIGMLALAAFLLFHYLFD